MKYQTYTTAAIITSFFLVVGCASSPKENQHSKADREAAPKTDVQQVNSQSADSSPATEQPKRLVIVVPEEFQDSVEDLITLIQSAPDAEVFVVAQANQEDEQSQNTFMLQSEDEEDDE